MEGKGGEEKGVEGEKGKGGEGKGRVPPKKLNSPRYRGV